jgi:hypothetical protein
MNARALFVFALLSHGLWGLAMTASAPRAFAVDVTPNDDSQLPFFPLRDYRLTWQLVGAENRALARPDGSIAMERSLASN